MLVIVARDQQSLFDYFTWGFAKIWGARVIKDRRLGTRRERAPKASPAQERRQSDRRHQPAMRAELRARGFVIATR